MIMSFFRGTLCGTLMASLVIVTPATFAAGGRSSDGTTTTTNTSTSTNTTTQNTTTQSTSTTSEPSTVNSYSQTINTSTQNSAIGANELNKTGNTQNQGDKAGSAQNMGMLAGLAGAAFSAAMAARACSGKKPDPSCPAWIMGALASAAVAAAMGAAKKKSDQTVADVSIKPIDTAVDPKTESRLVETERQVAETAKNVGMTVDPKTRSLRLADGRVIKSSDLGNKAALAAAGLSAAEISSFQDAAETALKEGGKVAAKGLDSSGTGSGEALEVGGGSAKQIEAANVPEVSGAGGRNREPAQIQGLSKDFNGNPIGVASENLFTLINRRYDHVASQKHLLSQ